MPALSLFSRQFFPYFCTQALGAFNDNVFKNLVILVLVYGHIQDNMGLSAGVLSNVVGALFIAPFVLFSGLAGLWCTQLETSRWIRLLKWFELVIMLCAAVGFYLQSTPILLVSVFLMGLHSALFGPVKYAYLPNRLPTEHLVKANAWVEASTFLAIVLGTLFAGALLALNPKPQFLGLAVLVFAALGVWAAYGVPIQRVPIQRVPTQEVPAQTSSPPTSHPLAWPTLGLLWQSTQQAMQAAKAVPSVYLSVLGISSFWCVGSIVLSNLPVLAQQNLCLNEASLGWLLALFAIGIAMGSMLAHVFSNKHVELGLVPLASLGLGLGLVGLYNSLGNAVPCGTGTTAFLANPHNLWVGGWLLLCGIFGGLYAVPLYTWIQLRAPSPSMGLVISYNNMQNAVFMVLGALLCLGLLAMGAQVEHTLLLALAINICTSIIIFKTIPEFLFRLVVVLVVRCIYKLRSQDIHCIPMQGRAMLVANHISWIDVLVIAATCPRPPVFVMHHSVAQWPVLGWFFRVVARAIPIAGKNENEALYHAAFLRIQAALENDELICIFPEGAISADGHIGPFKSGLFKALATTPAPVYAVGLSGLWHTAFSRQRKTIWKKLRSAWRSKTLQAHYATVPSHINTAEALQSHVQSLIKP